MRRLLLTKTVLLLWNNQRLPTYTLDAGAIADLEVAPSQPPPPASGFDLPTLTAASHRENVPPPRSQPQTEFVDPAILSYSKPNTRASQPPIQPVSPIMMADTAIPSPMSVSQVDLGRRPAAKQSSISSIATATTLPRNQIQPPIPHKHRSRRDSQATAILTEPFDALAVGDEVDVSKKKLKSKHKSNTSQTGPGIIDVKDINGPLSLGSGNAREKPKKSGKGKGWRSTPLIEEVPPPQPTNTISSTAKHRKTRGRRLQEQDANGWATEDATDIQDLPEFDFAENLSKFDKRQVFDDLRRDDTTADEERLASFNRLGGIEKIRGTNGGRNLHWSENVLDSTLPSNMNIVQARDRDVGGWNSDADDTNHDNEGLEYEQTHYSSGRGSRRANSRKPVSSRKGSMLPTQLERTESPTSAGRPFLAKTMTTSPMNGSVNGSTAKGQFRLGNGKQCHCVSPLQMLEIEQLCISELGLTEDMLSENAGRSIAEAVLRPSTAGISEVRNVVVLAGNHKSGARAIVAARHLRNRRLRVTVVVLGGEREDTLLEIVRKQLSIYRKGSGYADRWDEFQSKILAGGPQPDTIVDAILGVHVAFDELRTDDAATAFEMIRWASRSGANVLSVDVPSGLSATSGLITEAEGQLLVMNSKIVIAMGAPKVGLLHATATIMDGAEHGQDAEGMWNVVVADLGISMAVWQRHGSRRRQGVEFGSEWVVPVRFVSG